MEDFDQMDTVLIIEYILNGHDERSITIAIVQS